MQPNKINIITQLQKDILSLQGFRSPSADEAINLGIDCMNPYFPGNTFPTAAVHDFISTGTEQTAATGGFISGLLSGLMHKGAPAIWISNAGTIFPPALKSFGIEPDKIIFIDVKNARDSLWVMEETLKCKGIAAVVCEIPDITFTNTRRLQLSVEQSRVTGFLLRNNPRSLGVNACVSRWKISSLPSIPVDGLPGIGLPRWNIELLKMRNGKPGTWQMEWYDGKFHRVSPLINVLPQELQRKAG